MNVHEITRKKLVHLDREQAVRVLSLLVKHTSINNLHCRKAIRSDAINNEAIVVIDALLTDLELHPQPKQ